jgi:hypothetical protein
VIENPHEFFTSCSGRCLAHINRSIAGRRAFGLEPLNSWRDLPGLLSTHQLVQQRLGKSKRRGKFEPLVQIQRLMQANFPELSVHQHFPNSMLRFAKPVGVDALFVVVWSVENHFGLGQSVNLSLGLRPAAQTQGFDYLVRPLSHFFGEADATFWIAEKAADVETLWADAAAFLKPVLSHFEGDFAESQFTFADRSETARSAITARQACQILEPMVYEWAADAKVIDIVASMFEAEHWGWSLSSTGKLRANGAWHLRYWSESKQRQAQGWQPFAGSPEFRCYVDPIAELPTDVGSEWMDSDAAAAKAIALATDIPNDYELSGMTLKKSEAAESAARWQVAFGPSGQFHRGLAVTFDATSGHFLAWAGS